VLEDAVVGKKIAYRYVNGRLEAGDITLTVQEGEDWTIAFDGVEFNDLIACNDINRVTAYLMSESNKQISFETFANLYAKKLISSEADIVAVTCLLKEALKDASMATQSIAALLATREVRIINTTRKNKDDIIFDDQRAITGAPYQGFVNRLLDYISDLIYQLREGYYRNTFKTITNLLLDFGCVLIILMAVCYVYGLNLVGYVIAADDLNNNNNKASEWYYCLITAICVTLILYIFRWARRQRQRHHLQIETSGVDPIVKTSCITRDNYAEVAGPLSDQVKWCVKIPHNLDMTRFLSLGCDCVKEGLRSVAPVFLQAPQPIIYHICAANNYCATKRQATAVTKFDPVMLNEFDLWFDKIFRLEFVPLLRNFSYSYSDWYNHLNTKQQHELSRVEPYNIPLSNDYTMFVKVEKQLYDNGKAPKNRCICSPNVYHKYVLGPVTYALESLFSANVFGYCGGKNWEQLEDYYNQCAERGQTLTMQLDGSGFDRTQFYELKRIVDHKIYMFLVNNRKIHHVDAPTYRYYACPEWRKIRVNWFTKDGLETMGFINVRGTVFSGSMDTTLMNTLRMSLYNRFVAERHFGLKKDQYGLLCKGDDAVMFLPAATNITTFRQAVLKVFTENKTGTHGLGQIAKYIKIGNIEDVDFCSTSTFYAPSIHSYKIIRKLDRFLTLTPWSRKALRFSKDERKVYLHQLYLSNLKWMDGLPIFSAYNDLLKQNLLGVRCRLRTGQSKVLSHDDEIQQIDAYYYMDKDFIYSDVDRQSSRKPSRHDMCLWLLEKYDLSVSEIDKIEETIRRADKIIDCPIINKILDS
jgi:hypothetical protein